MTGSGYAAVRVDANSEIGLGHLRRCATLLSQLSADGFSTRVVSRDKFGPETASLLAESPVTWIGGAATDEASDAEATLAALGRTPPGPSWVIVDHYGLGERWEKIVRDAGHSILAIDDFRNRLHCADILVSDSSVPFDPALNRAPVKARELLGPGFALVDPEFAFSDERHAAGGMKRLLVSYGGSDPTDETSKALEAVRLLRQDKSCGWLGEIDVIVGPANTRRERVIEHAKGIAGTTVHLAPSSLAPLMRKADIVLTAGGNSMVEALTMRKPCLVTLTSDNQALIVAQLLEKRAIVSLGEQARVVPGDVAKAVTGAVADYERLSASLRSLALFDHHGARRISEAIQSMPRGINA